jgi:alanyl-tRNA synthetase
LDRLILEPSALESAENRANAIIFEDRPIVTRFVSPEDVPTLGLRKAPTVDSDIRIVDVEGFDRSPCGGTHCSRSGEVGQISLRRAERRGQETRVEFACGWRALFDLRWKTRAINEMAQSFSVKDRDVAAAVQRLSGEAAEQRRELQQLRSELLPAESERLLTRARNWEGLRVVVEAFPGRDPSELRRLASLLTATPGVIALLGSGGQLSRVVFARSNDAGVVMASLVSRVCQALGGKGGGQADLAQGGGFPGERLAEALELAFHSLTEHQGESK